MEPPVSPIWFSILLFAGMLVMIEAGRYFSPKSRREVTDEDRPGLGAIEGAVFALFGLLVAFTFGGAALRFNEKRQLIADEVNAIGTAYLRLHLLPVEQERQLQDLFRSYVDSRLETYRIMPNMAAAELEMQKSAVLQNRIWADAVSATRLPQAHPDAGKLLLPALNSMIDIATIRTMALQIHPPRIVYVLLFVLGALCSLLAGFRMGMDGKRSWLHILGFPVITVVVVFVILDLEYPRAGLIRLANSDQLIVQLRESMK